MASSRRSTVGGREERQTNGTVVNRAAVEEEEPTHAAGSLGRSSTVQSGSFESHCAQL
jgi:hypothetical protein